MRAADPIWVLLLSVCLGYSHAAVGGPPFLTDDPEPTDTGHWEIYAPLGEAEGRRGRFAGTAGAEINYGAAPNLQLTFGFPLAYVHEPGDWHWATGDLELSAKYRFYDDEAAHFSISVFPGITLPTAGKHLGADHLTALLPVWFQKDSGGWSVFGGGGYAINPGVGQRNYLKGGLAVSCQLSDRLLLGIEADRQGAGETDGAASTSVGIGAILDLPGPLRLLASAGPTFEDHGRTGFHAFLALGIDL
jgi:hypothetical protein